MFRKVLAVQKKTLLVISVLIIVSLACSLPVIGGSVNPADSPNSPNSENLLDENGGDELRCTQMGYPCTFAETPREILERGMELMDLAEEIFKQEGNTIAVAERFREEGDIAEMYFDERGVWYRVEASPPLVFLHPDAFVYGLSEDEPDAEASLGGNVQLSPPQNGDGPIGENPPGEKALKKALFVNPIVWQFDSSIYDTVRSQLEDHFDYQCPDCITYLRGDQSAKDLINEENQAAGPSYEQFLGWNDYDLIHVFAHGYQFCPGQSVTRSGLPVVPGELETFPENTGGVIAGADVTEGECVTMIQTGHYQTKNYILENPRDVPGIAWVYKPGEEVWGELVTTDFFRSKYPGGLDDAILYFTSCQLFKDHSLAEVLAGENTAVFGWSDTVKGVRGIATAKQFFTELIENGLRSTVAYQKTIESESHTEHSEDWFGAQLEKVVDGGKDPRGREVVILMQPVFRKFLEENDAVPVEGIPGDGKPDDLFILIQVDGVDEDQTPEQFEVHLALDGEELPETFKPTEKVGDYSYRGYEILSLPFDAADRETVELEAWIDLPEGGDTRHYLMKVELAACGWMGSLSGSKEGDLEGEIVFPSSNLTAANADQLTLLSSQGYLGPDTSSSGMPTPSELASLPEAFILGSRSQFPFMLLIPNQGGTVMLENGFPGIGQQVGVSLVEDSPERVEGGFTASVTDLMTQSGYSVTGELTWHVDSFCSLDVILELAANPLPADLAP